MPLFSTKLKYEDCVQLKERTQQHIANWTIKSLAYAGRALLIQSVLFSMQTYWCSLFILPQKIINGVEAMLRSFLWSGLNLTKVGAKVS